MPLHSFVDETKSPFRLVAVFIHPAHLTELRQAVSSMVMPGQRRIHFHTERDSRRAQILGRMLEMPIEAALFEASGKGREKDDRDRCLAHLIRDHRRRNVQRLVLERDDSHVEADHRIFTQELGQEDPDRLAYEHLRAFEEPLLAIPDAVGWCWVRGGHWQVKAKQIVTEVFQT